MANASALQHCPHRVGALLRRGAVGGRAANVVCKPWISTVDVGFAATSAAAAAINAAPAAGIALEPLTKLSMVRADTVNLRNLRALVTVVFWVAAVKRLVTPR